MTFRSGNKAIRDHRQEGKDLLVFTDLGKGKGVRYEGLFEYIDYREVHGHDKDRNWRKIIVFDLVRVNTAAVAEPTDATAESNTGPVQAPAASLEDLRTTAYAACSNSPAEKRTGQTKRTWRERSRAVRAYVLARAKGTCEACDQEAPFLRQHDGSPYLEPYHTTRLADDGLDHPSTVAAICPTCHRRIHFGIDGDSWNQQLQKRLAEKERTSAGGGGSRQYRQG